VHLVERDTLLAIPICGAVPLVGFGRLSLVVEDAAVNQSSCVRGMGGCSEAHASGIVTLSSTVQQTFGQTTYACDHDSSGVECMRAI